MRYLTLLLLLSAQSLNSVTAFELSGQRWKNNQTLFHVNLNGANSAWSNAFNDAITSWNSSTPFTFFRDAEVRNPCATDNENSIGFTSDLCGSQYGSSTIAVTLSRYTVGNNQYTETDIVFNNSQTWSVYTGPARINPDLRRVAVHELGHALGLDHENQTTAIMNAVITNTEIPQTDDIAGVAALYGNDHAARDDFNGDDQSDIVLRNTMTGVNRLFFTNNAQITNQGNLPNVSLDWALAAKGDFNGDGFSDLLWRNTNTGVNWVYLMRAGEVLQSTPLNSVSDQNWTVVGSADFDGNGTDDILWYNKESGLTWLYKLHGNVITSSSRVAQVSDTHWQIVAISDLNGDNKSDILWRHATTGINWVYYMNGSGIAKSVALNRVSDLDWQVIGSGDLNADGYDDILWWHAGNGQVYSYLMGANQNFVSSPIARIVDPQWRLQIAGDFNKDQKTDILWRHNTTGTLWLYLMNGSQIADSKMLSSLPDIDWQLF